MPPATTPANRVVMAVLGASKRSIDSITSNEDARGAAKAAASPAPAPAAKSCFRSPDSTRPHLERGSRYMNLSEHMGLPGLMITRR